MQNLPRHQKIGLTKAAARAKIGVRFCITARRGLIIKAGSLNKEYGGCLLRRVPTGRGLKMYAIIETGGKQYRVEEGQTVRVEKLPAEKGEEIVFDRVLLYSDGAEARIGYPYLDGCRVKGKVTVQRRGRKIVVFKYKAKKNYRRKQGHRQPFTEVLVSQIEIAK